VQDQTEANGSRLRGAEEVLREFDGRQPETEERVAGSASTQAADTGSCSCGIITGAAAVQ